MMTTQKRRNTGDYITWSDRYSVGIPSIDSQHIKIIGMINALHAARDDGEDTEVVAKVMNDLIDYTQTHFTYEEDLLARHGYPQSQAHKQEHAGFVRLVEGAYADLNLGNAKSANWLIDFLNNWLIDHICVSDMDYSKHLRAAGVQ